MNVSESLHFRDFERLYYPVAGLDEVGRGALFGPVVAAAVVLPPDRWDFISGLGVTDSKKLSPGRRAELDVAIREVAISYGIGSATVVEIAELNILEASLLAMERAIAQLTVRPDRCLIDGNCPLRFRLIPSMPQTTVIRGDSLSLSIAAASIVAKVWRDRLIAELAEKYPGYDLAQNKGYGTAKHRDAIFRLGLTDLHRQSFKIQEPVKPRQLSINCDRTTDNC